MRLEQRSLTAIAGFHWEGNVIDLISAIEAPAVAYEVPVLHDYIGFSEEPPYIAALNKADEKIWGVCELSAQADEMNSFLVKTAGRDSPADLPWLFNKIASLNESGQRGLIPPIENLVVLAETMKDVWTPEGDAETQTLGGLNPTKIKSVFLVRVDSDGSNFLPAAKSLAAFRRLAKSVGGVCAPFRRESVKDVARVAGYHIAGLLGELSRDDIKTDAGRKLFADCLSVVSPS